MTKKDLIKKLHEIYASPEGDYEEMHVEADTALIEFIDDKEITKAYDRIGKWYA